MNFNSSGRRITDGADEKYSGDFQECGDAHTTMADDALVMAAAMAVGGALQTESPSNQSRPEMNEQDGMSYQQQYPPNTLPSSLSPMETPPALLHHHMRGGHSIHNNSDTTAASTTAAITSGSDGKKHLPAGIPHVYHDYGHFPEMPGFARKKTGGVTQPFPDKLHEMLKTVDGTSQAEIVSWLPHGRAFLVRKSKIFTETIMPRYFKQTKLTSFQRQLNLYGFRRITQGPDAGAYYHELFLRDRPSFCQQMSRQKVKGTGHKQAADAKTEPNFYLMRPVEPHGGTSSTQQLPGTMQQSQQASFRMGSSGMAPEAPLALQQTPSTMFNAGAASESNTATDIYRPVPPPPNAFNAASAGSILNSPASPGLHGAAHLLQGIASGHANSLQMPNDFDEQNAVPLIPSPQQPNLTAASSNEQQQQPSEGYQQHPVRSGFLLPRLSTMKKL